VIFINNVNINGVITYFSETIDKFLILIFVILLISFKLTPAYIFIAMNALFDIQRKFSKIR